MKHIEELDGLRCFAILPVIAGHYLPLATGAASVLLANSWFGVDLFFVISGYLITTILMGMRGALQPYRRFYWRRMLRIFPLYYLLVLIVALCMGSLAPVGRHALFLTSLDVRPFLTIWQRLHHGGFEPITSTRLPYVFSGAADGVSMVWSLSVEELFYVAWAPVVLLGSRRTIAALTAAPIVFCPLLRLFAHTVDFREYNGFAFRIDSIMFGAGVALLLAGVRRGELSIEVLRRGVRMVLMTTPALLGMLLLYDGVLLGRDARLSYSFALFGYTLLGLCCAALVAWCVLSANSSRSRHLRASWLRYVGRISYGLYLIHGISFVLVLRTVRHFEGSGWNPGYGCAAVAALLTFSLAVLSWRYYESWFLHFKDWSPLQRSLPLRVAYDARES